MPATPKRANQADIAARLGVSISTVSRALANEAGISEAVRRDVQKLALAMGYKSKHGMAPARDKRAMALVPLSGAMGSLASFYHDIVGGMRAQADELGMVLDVRLVNEASVTLDTVRRQLDASGASGLLLAGIDPWDEFSEWCIEATLPLVLVNGLDPAMRFSSVAPANFFGAYLATKRLLDAGHRKILHYTYRYRPTILQRQRGFEAAIADTPGAIGTVVSSTERNSHELLADILSGKYDITAIFCWNDISAVQMVESLFGPDTPLPPNFSIIGFDDLPIAEMATPRLSTIHVDRESIGRGAIRLLMEQMDGNRAIQQLEIGVTAIVGGTVHIA